MARRSAMNDRYRVEQKGHTRKSASSAKPKREAGTTATTAKKPAKSAKPKLFGKGPAREPVGAIPSTPEMKKMRRYWWIAMGVAIVIAVAMVPISKYKNSALDSALFGLYAVALSAALYLEFGPLRKMRREAVAAAKAKSGKGGKSASKATTQKAAEPKRRESVRPAAAPASSGLLRCHSRPGRARRERCGDPADVSFRVGVDQVLARHAPQRCAFAKLVPVRRAVERQRAEIFSAGETRQVLFLLPVAAPPHDRAAAQAVMGRYRQGC